MGTDPGTHLLAPRQKRIDNTDPALFAMINNVHYVVHNYSRDGLGLVVSLDAPLASGDFTIELNYADKQIYLGLGQVRHVRKSTSSESPSIAGVRLSTELATEHLEALIFASSMGRRIQQTLQMAAQLPEKMRAFVENFTIYFDILENAVESDSARIATLSRVDRAKYLTELQSQTGAMIDSDFTKVGLRLEELFAKMNDADKNAALGYLQSRVRRWFEGAELVTVSDELPLGYLGNPEVLELCRRNRFEGSTFLGQILHHCLINSSTLANVRSRRLVYQSKLKEAFERSALAGSSLPQQSSTFAAQKTSKEEFNILALCLGENADIAEFLLSQSLDSLKKVSICFVDFMEANLLRLQDELNSLNQKTGKFGQCSYVLNAPKYSQSSSQFQSQGRRPFNAFVMGLNSAQLGKKFDFVLVPMLYDYLDGVMTRTLSLKLLSLLAPRGQVFFGKTPAVLPRRALFQCLLNWEVHASDAESLKALLPFEAQSTFEEQTVQNTLFCSFEAKNSGEKR